MTTTKTAMMKADPARTPREIAHSVEDENLLSSFDPVIEGSSFQILAEGIDLADFNRELDTDDVLSAPEVLATFDLAASLANVPEKLFFRIGEVADLLDVKAYVLRFWETEFPMVHPTKSRSGQRVYRKKDVEMLLLIKHLLYVERFSIEGARKRIRELKMKPAAVANAVAEKSENSAVLKTGSKRAVTSTASAESMRELSEAIQQTKLLAAADLSKFFRF